jgi:uncharacterized protein
MALENLLGREPEQAQLEKLLHSPDAEFLAIYGRRRVGKTFLIREYFEHQTQFFELVGQKDTTRRQQLENFRVSFRTRFSTDLPAPKNWSAALQQLREALATADKTGKQVLFFDETPWLATPKSGFLQALDHFWNAWASRRKNIILVVCGSAASWMIKNIVHNKGGLHNRVTGLIHLKPFDLKKTEHYLKSRSVRMDHKQIVELYMCMGGIPLYLRHVEPHLSAAQNIDRICFTRSGFLASEFSKLFHSLFDEAEKYIHIVRVLARQGKGMTREELLKKSGMRSGGGFSDILTALESSDFISIQTPFERSSRESVIRLIDEFSIFHLTFIEPAPKHIFREIPGGYWPTQRKSRQYTSWAGFAFEDVCLKHIEPIKKAIGIQAVSTREFPWYYRPKTPQEIGVQIDLLIERNDRCYSLCEIKFSEREFVIAKAYAEELKRKKRAVERYGKVGYTVFIALISTYGVRRNDHARDLVNQFVQMEDLFS